MKIGSSQREVRAIEGSSYRGQNYSKCMNEIHGKSILVRVSARFELARVRVIGIRLYVVFRSELAAHAVSNGKKRPLDSAPVLFQNNL